MPQVSIRFSSATKVAPGQPPRVGDGISVDGRDGTILSIHSDPRDVMPNAVIIQWEPRPDPNNPSPRRIL